MKIVVGVDGSAYALAGAEWVAQLPLRADDTVAIVAAAQRPVIYHAWAYVQTPTTVEISETMWRDAQNAARRAADQAAAIFEDLPCAVSTVLAEGHPIDALSDAARDSGADLLVIGPRGKGRLARILLGSVSHGLLESMPVPVLVARGPSGPLRRVLLATDGSPHSVAAARYLARFPLPSSVRIDIVTVDDRSMVPQPDGREYWASGAVDAAVDILAEAGLTSLPEIKHGYPQRKILALADELDSDLIVTGARGLGGFSGLILGSVSRAVSTAARCSVLVVGGKSARGDEDPAEGDSDD